MDSIKKISKIIGLFILIVLASVGIGITGAAPVSWNTKGREGNTDPKIELVEEKKDRTDASEVLEIR